MSETNKNTKLNITGNTAPGTRFFRRNSTAWLICLVSLALVCMAIAPVAAGSRYMAGSPELTAYISGTNEVSAGDDLSLAIVIENKGLNEFKFVQSGIVDRDDLPNTAKNLVVRLDNGSAPIVIKSDPQMLGDLKASTSVTATFKCKVNQDAAAGTYILPVNLTYTYLYQAEQFGTETIQ